MHIYPGTNAPGSPVIPTSPTAGTGWWPDAVVVDDGDNRDAANAMAAAEAVVDRTAFLAWRMINIVDGCTLAWTALVKLANQIWFNGAIRVRNGLTIENAGTVYCDRAATWDGVTSFGGAAIQRTPGSYLGRPTVTLPSSNYTLPNAWYYDVADIPDPPANLNTGSTGWAYTLSVPSAPLVNTVHLLVRRSAAGGATNVIKDAGGGTLVTFHENQVDAASVLLRMSAGTTQWEVIAYNGLKKSWFTSAAITAMGGQQNWAFY